MESSGPGLSLLREGDAFSFDFSVGAESMRAFAALSGDNHQLHVNADYALSRGFRGVVVYGAILVAQVSRLIGKEIAVKHCIWNSLRIDFRAPLYVDEAAVLEAKVINYSEAVNLAKIKFSITASDRTIAIGSVDVMVYDA